MSLRSRAEEQKKKENKVIEKPKAQKPSVPNKTVPSKNSQPSRPAQDRSSDYNDAAMKTAGVQVTASFEFAKSQYTRSLGILILSFIITISVVLETYYVLSYKPPIKYIPVYADSSIIDPIPLDKPFRTDAEMRQWLADASKEIFSYGYLNVDTHGSKIKKYFTDKGYEDYMNMFKNSPDISRVKSKKMEVIASSIGSPTKLHDGDKLSGKNFAYWEYKISIRQVFISPNDGIIPATYEMVATIVRQDQRQYKDGIAIHSFRVVSSSNIK